MDFIRAHQLNFMLFMCGMCGILAVMTMLMKFLPRKTKRILSAMELSAMALLFFDRLAYIYKGEVGDLASFMVRLSNGMVFLLSLLIPFLVTRYLVNIYISEAKLTRIPFQLVIADVLFLAGLVLLVVSHFTGLYYYFDEHNIYHRAPYYIISYIMPLLIIILQEWSIIQHRKRIRTWIAGSLLIAISLPTIAAILQLFAYGISLINMTTAFVVIVFYTFALRYLGESAERTRVRELIFYKETQKKEAAAFEQTMEALANAIDAKDAYTHGHSARVAQYSKRIAKEAGLSEKKCDEIYFAALLHDVGKIGIRHDIINKVGKLTEEEFCQIKSHPVLGDQILSSIKQAPFLSIGARYHHERYDGRGYPDGLSGDDIPEIARIIAVADAYDAMTSVRSYRQPLERSAVRAELIKGMGTQFDPRFAEIMLRLMDEGESNPAQIKSA